MNKNGRDKDGGKDPRRDVGAQAEAGAASTATDYWSSMLQATTSFWQGQLTRWSSALEQMREGTYDASRGMQDIARTWDAWATLMASPCQTGGPGRQLPTLLFIVDGEAEFVGPQEAPTSVFLPPGVTTVVTDLYRVGGSETARGRQTAGTRSIEASAHVRAQFSPAGDRVEVALVNLGRGQRRRDKQGISPGLYVGAVYATEVATRRPLAVIYALVEESTVP
jgi:hypothetical protein